MNRLHAIVLATVIGAATLAPGSAYAATKPHSQRHVDTTNDVSSISISDSSEEPAVQPEPTHSGGDIRTSSATYAARKVRMSMRLGDLITGTGQAAYGFAIGTSRHRSFVAVLELVKGSTTQARVHLEKGNGRKVRCRMAWDIVPSTKVVRIDVPRSCIGRPRWVRVGMGSVSQEGSELYFDDAERKGANLATLEHFPIYGARIFH